MNPKIGIWLDHKNAVIVSISAAHVTTRTVESNVEAHPHYTGQREGEGETKYEERHGQQLDRYYDDVISQIGVPDALLIFGPGEAKKELKERLGRLKTFSECSVALETSDKLTNSQILAKVKEHFGIIRNPPPTG